jgi:DNA repair protein RecO (recombination protein O)
MFAREQGRVSFICHLPKTGRGNIKKPYFQPLTVLDIVYDHRVNQQLQRFKDIRLAYSFTSIPFDPVKLSVALFLAEFLTFATRSEQQNEALFGYVENSLEWLDSVSEGFANFHLVFMMRLSRFIGFFPNLSGYETGAWFDLRNGTFTRVHPVHPDYLEPAEAARIGLLMRMSYENMRFFRLSRDERNRCTELVLYYYRLHVPNFPELRSLDVLKTLF